MPRSCRLISMDGGAMLFRAGVSGQMVDMFASGSETDDDGGMPSASDTYLHGHHDSVLRSHRWRTAENSAGYLLPRLAPDARVLDVGWGPGTATVAPAALGPRRYVTRI